MKYFRHIFSVILTLILALNTAGAACVINGVTVDNTDVSSSHNDCWTYANAIYKKIWGKNFSNQFDDPDNFLRNLSDNDLTLTPEHLKAYVSGAELGSVLRICNTEWLHSTDGWGHSQIIVWKDENGFTVFEGGLSAPPHRREQYYTWEDYCARDWLGGTYRYIKYIKWPGAGSYDGVSVPTGLAVTAFINCKNTFTLPAREINLYANVTDIRRFTYFDYGPTFTSPTYAIMNNGSRRYKVTANHNGQAVDLWFEETSDMSKTIEHSFGELLHEDAHPHKYYQECECGQNSYIGGNAQIDSCSLCNPQPEIEVSAIWLKYDRWHLAKGQQLSLKAYIAPSSAEGCAVIYQSTDNNIATVDSDGIVSGKEEGEVDIIASVGEKSARCHLEIETVNEIRFKNPFVQLNAGETIESEVAIVTTGIVPLDQIIWSDSNPGIVSIKESGKIVGLKAGVTMLTATCGGKSATLKVEVIAPGKSSSTVIAPEQPSFPDRPSPDDFAVHFERDDVYFQGQFADVPANQWFTDSIASAFEYGLMKGSSAETFNPYGDVTVAEAITMASRIHSIYTTGTENFNQTAPWYQVYLNYAYQNNIISRAYYNCDVKHKATRAQFSEIFANALPDQGLQEINQIMDGAIPDVSTSETYAGSVYKLYRAGILTGCDVYGKFSPETYITRAEASAIVARMAESNNRQRFEIFK